MKANRLPCTLWSVKALAVNPNHEMKRSLQITLTTIADSECAQDAHVENLPDVVRALQLGELSRVSLPPDARTFQLMLESNDETTKAVEAKRLGANLAAHESEDGLEVKLSLTYETALDAELLVWCANHLRGLVHLTASPQQLSLALPEPEEATSEPTMPEPHRSSRSRRAHHPAQVGA